MTLALEVAYGLVSVEVSCESVHPMFFFYFIILCHRTSKDLQNITNFTSFPQNNGQP
jgi:hypothetical protein